MESALYGIYALVVFVSEILLVRCAHSFDFWYVNNSYVTTVRKYFPWSILYIFKHFNQYSLRIPPPRLIIVSLFWFIFYDYPDYTVFTEVPTSPDNRDSTVPGYFIGVCTCKETQMNWTQDFIYPRVFSVASKQDLA